MVSAQSEAVVARLDAPTADDPTRIAVVSDSHVSPRAEGTAMVYHRAADRLRAALDDAEERGVDAIVSPGDLTKDGTPWEYERLDEILAGVETPFFSVPGNHDVPKASTETYKYGDSHETPPIDRFEREYAPEGTIPFVERVGPLDIVGLNTATQPDGSLAETHDGAVSADDVAWLEDTLGTLETPVVLMHHNTPAMYDQFRDLRDTAHPEMGLPPVMREPQPLMDVLTDAEVPLVITGHLHNLGVAKTGSTWEVTTPATGSFPQAYLLFDIDADGTTVRYIPVADTEGMTEAHQARRSDGVTSMAYTSFASIRLATLPLVDER